jgi:hypothetical protein
VGGTVAIAVAYAVFFAGGTVAAALWARAREPRAAAPGSRFGAVGTRFTVNGYYDYAGDGYAELRG